MKILYGAVVLVLVCVMVFSGWQVIRLGGEYLLSREQYADLEQYVSVETQSAAVSTEPAEEAQTAPTDAEGNFACRKIPHRKSILII